MDISLTYALVTPARNEERNLRRLADCVLGQTVRPRAWVIVDNGSTDATLSVANELAACAPWITVVSATGEVVPMRGGAVVRAFNAGLAALGDLPDVVVKLDADVSFEPDHFERLLGRFEADPRLGMASGLCLELDDGEWRAQHSTRSHVRGAVRAYRRACLEDVLPLEERIGWDGIDELRAAVLGWRTVTISDLEFLHHRMLGERERARVKWARQGEMAHYLGYRPSYLVLRAAYRALRDPSAVAMVWGYAVAVVRRRPRYADADVRAYLRREQSVRRIPRRVSEAFGRSEHV